ncbi:MAG: hypothetical protein AB7S26_11145 [Sandaracinaceae bacterium]
MRIGIAGRVLFAGWLVVSLLGCDDGAADPDGGRRRDGGGAERDGGTARDAGPAMDAGPRSDAGMAPEGVSARARALAMHLSGRADFLVGMGNDLDGAPTYDSDRAGAYVLGPSLDLHYIYLVGYGDNGGWPTWNANGTFPVIHADAASRHGARMMFTYYQLALDYETGSDPLTDGDRMRQWLTDVRLLLQRIGEQGDPAIVHFEPDLFGYLQQRMASMSTTPGAYPMLLHQSGIPECASLPEVAASFGACMAAMRDALAPNVRLGLHASQWADYYDPSDPSADVAGAGRSVAQFLAAMGGDQLDLVVVETLDRDAGFWETNGGTASCSVTGGARGAVYWDETNATVPNFHQHFSWVRAVTEELGLPAIFWQTPFGVPSNTCGGSDGMWRDNRVHYFFGHTDELIAAGAFGAVFGTGAGGQTYITSDGNQFRDAAAAYVASPSPL